MPDLWPDDFGTEDVVPPVVILREQGQALAKKTGGLVVGNVISKRNGDEFLHTFLLEVPTLDDYSYQLLQVKHPILLYPAKLIRGYGGLGTVRFIDVDGPSRFLQVLQEEFGSTPVKQIVLSLKAQAAVESA
jgi:hypothetical protein